MCSEKEGVYVMSTVAFTECCPNKVYANGVMPRRNGDVRRIVREEIERQKKLDELDRKYEAGEISKFEYNLTKFALNLPKEPAMPPVVYAQNPTVEYMA